MTKPQQPPEPSIPDTPDPREDDDRQSKELDEALGESFPASDPVAIDITSIDPGTQPSR